MTEYDDFPSPFDSDISFAIRPIIGTKGRVPKSGQPWPMESSFLHIDMLTPEEGFESLEEAEATIAQYIQIGKKPKFPKPSEPWHQAQEVAYQGRQKKSARGRKLAAQKAL